MASIERRSHFRKTITKPVTYEVRAPGKDFNSIPAELLDISRGGACIVGEIVEELGRVVKLMRPLLGTDLRVPCLAEVRWAVPVDDRFKIGLKFVV